MKIHYLPLLMLSLFALPLPAATVEEALSQPGRLEADVARDARSRPDVVIPLLALQPGDRVADIFGGGGYYSEILASVVGPKGEVILQNNAAYKQFAGKTLAARFDGRDPGRITLLESEAEDLRLGEGRLDAAIIIMSYHDLYHVDAENGWRAIDAGNFLGQIHAALKAGGRFLIVDHAAEAGSGKRDAQDLHRIDPEFARRDIESHGFVLVGSSEVLRNSNDDHSALVFAPEIRFKTDRFIQVFEKR